MSRPIRHYNITPALTDLLARKKWSCHRLALASGVSNTNLTNILSGQCTRGKTIAKIAAALRVPIETFIPIIPDPVVSAQKPRYKPVVPPCGDRILSIIEGEGSNGPGYVNSSTQRTSVRIGMTWKQNGKNVQGGIDT